MWSLLWPECQVGEVEIIRRSHTVGDHVVRLCVRVISYSKRFRKSVLGGEAVKWSDAQAKRQSGGPCVLVFSRVSWSAG
jgi:hypothetical protein